MTVSSSNFVVLANVAITRPSPTTRSTAVARLNANHQTRTSSDARTGPKAPMAQVIEGPSSHRLGMNRQSTISPTSRIGNNTPSGWYLPLSFAFSDAAAASLFIALFLCAFVIRPRSGLIQRFYSFSNPQSLTWHRLPVCVLIRTRVWKSKLLSLFPSRSD